MNKIEIKTYILGFDKLRLQDERNAKIKFVGKKNQIERGERE